MTVLIWIGAGLAVIGMIGVLYSMIAVARAKRQNLTDDQMRDRIRKVIPLNLGTLFVAMIGLMMVVVGVMLS
jgi:hypothetical protein